eukprot:6754-Heterococcus_DN1.PRE.2
MALLYADTSSSIETMLSQTAMRTKRSSVLDCFTSVSLYGSISSAQLLLCADTGNSIVYYLALYT